MAKKNFEQIIAIIVMTFIIVGISLPAFAMDEVSPYTDGYYYWKIDSVGASVSDGYTDWKWVYTGYPATEAGEVDTINESISVGVDVSGTLNVSAAAIRGAVGVGTSVTVSLGVGRSTRPLNKGEYVKAYIRGVYEKTPVIQRQYFRIDGYDSATNNVATAYCRAANKLGQIRFEYYTSNSTKSTEVKVDKPFRVEYYSISENGEIEPVSVEEM